MITFFEKMSDLLAANVPFVSVTVVDTIGSVPNDAGTKMLVTQDGLYYGTVGGGKVESRAVKEAMGLLARDIEPDEAGFGSRHAGAQTHFVNWSLERDIGMTCGGSVKLYFEAFNRRPWLVTIFGAGHCACALAGLLINLECRVTCLDPREDWLNKLPESPKLTKLLTADMPGAVANIPAASFVILMTMGHTTDKPILLEILRTWSTRQFPYLGVIGSYAKAARLKKDIKEAGLPPSLENAFYCPIGLPIGSNHPQEIAISIAAQLLEVRDKVWGNEAGVLAAVAETTR